MSSVGRVGSSNGYPDIRLQKPHFGTRNTTHLPIVDTESVTIADLRSNVETIIGSRSTGRGAVNEMRVTHFIDKTELQ